MCLQLIALAERILSRKQYDELQKLLTDLHLRDCGKYDDLSKVLPIISTVYSQEDYVDFIAQGFYIKDDLFILGYLSYRGKCIETGYYDEDMPDRIADYIKQQADLYMDIQPDEDDMTHFWQELRDVLIKNQYTLLIFNSDHYYEDQIFIFVLKSSLYSLAIDDEWYYNI